MDIFKKSILIGLLCFQNVYLLASQTSSSCNGSSSGITQRIRNNTLVVINNKREIVNQLKEIQKNISIIQGNKLDTIPAILKILDILEYTKNKVMQWRFLEALRRLKSIDLEKIDKDSVKEQISKVFKSLTELYTVQAKEFSELFFNSTNKKLPKDLSVLILEYALLYPDYEEL